MIISGGLAGGTMIKMRMEARALEQLANMDMAGEVSGLNQESSTSGSGTAVDSAVLARQMEINRRLARSKALAEKSDDYKAWFQIKDTKINYPVMANALDSQYYLHRDFEGKYSFAGTPFLGDECDENSQSIIVYAHHMNNGTMFGELEKYEKQEYRDAHPVICFDTVDEAREYEVVAAFRTRLLYDDEEGFRYYEYTGDLDEERLAEFEKGVAAINAYDSMPEFDTEGKYIMLSTCAYHARYGRFVVVGKLIEERQEG